MICGTFKSDSHEFLSIYPQQTQSFGYPHGCLKVSTAANADPQRVILTLECVAPQVAAARRTPRSVSRSIRPQSIAVATKAMERVSTAFLMCFCSVLFRERNVLYCSFILILSLSLSFLSLPSLPLLLLFFCYCLILLLCAVLVRSISILCTGFPLLGFVWSFETRLCTAAAQVQQEQQHEYQAHHGTQHGTTLRWQNHAKPYHSMRFPK